MSAEALEVAFLDIRERAIINEDGIVDRKGFVPAALVFQFPGLVLGLLEEIGR